MKTFITPVVSVTTSPFQTRNRRDGNPVVLYHMGEKETRKHKWKSLTLKILKSKNCSSQTSSSHRVVFCEETHTLYS